MNPDYGQSPFNAMPPLVLGLAALIAAVEVMFQLGARGLLGGAQGVGLRVEAFNAMAFIPQIFDRMWETGDVSPRQLLRLVSYGLVHLGFTHALFVVVFLLALGKLVAETLGQAAVAAVLVVASVAGALAYGAIPGVSAALIGGYPGVYGLIGAFTFLLWTGLGQRGESRMRAFSLIGALLGIQLIFALFLGAGYDWVADLAGFAAGFAVTPLLAPGGVARLIRRMRDR